MKKENKGKIIFENEGDYKRLLKYERDKWFKYGREKAIEEFKNKLKKLWELLNLVLQGMTIKENVTMRVFLAHWF